jgi:predicted phosphodiesterase
MDISFSDPIAVIADIHGNSDALAAVLADIDALGITQIVNLGDHFSGPLAAAETAQMIASRPIISIRANHDRYLIEQVPAAMAPSDRAAFDQLSPAHLNWVRALPPTFEIGAEIFICHGTPDSDETYWMEDILPSGHVVMRNRAAIEGFAAGVAHPLILCAHTHTPRALHLADGRLIVNPGSVGLAAYEDDLPVFHVMQVGSPDARYAIVQKAKDAWQVSFQAVPYDTARMARLARNAQREDWAIAVETGWLTPAD